MPEPATLPPADVVVGGVVAGSGVTSCCGVWPVGRSPFVPPYSMNPESRVGHPWRYVASLPELDYLRNAGPWFALACPLCHRSATV